MKENRIQVNALGDPCPIPVVKTKNAIKELAGAGEVETLVDNEIAVQNLTKMANQKGYGVRSKKLEDQKYRVVMAISAEHAGPAGATQPGGKMAEAAGMAQAGGEMAEVAAGETCIPDARTTTVVAISSDRMGRGNEELGGVLMKSFLFALTQQDQLPSTILFYNGGAHITSEDSPMLEDLKNLEAQGVEILTCGTCLKYYGLEEQLKIGGVSNMYEIVEKMMNAGKVIKP